jgi:hypothetical protein
MGCSALKQLIPLVETSSRAISPLSGLVPGGAVPKGNDDGLVPGGAVPKGNDDLIFDVDAGRGRRDGCDGGSGVIWNENRVVRG